MTQNLVALRGVGKTFKNGTLALSGLDLDVEAGEFLTLLGPSGCGKSTILRLIAGLDKPSAGAIERPFPERIAEIGFVFQEPTLMPWASVFDNVYLPLRLKKESRAKAKSRVEATLSLVGLSAFAKAYPRELSGGMRMRVSIARALVLKPALLLLDEPFAALDEITRFRLNDDLIRLKQELGTTVVFVTHSVYESVYLSTRIAIMAPRPGRIVKEIAIAADLPRNESFRMSAAYGALCVEASKSLQAAMAQGAYGEEEAR
ncbi:ABC transporter ATP-binding protein [Methyloferula stellata]|uniref:ABC transporter ATP-binding protein n=1 Tax=Methyloferula stellata TaxID=876270 RepID=UPI00037EF325|nr:ABC transporter ATP-binding protein [Methyloferula stellata]